MEAFSIFDPQGLLGQPIAEEKLEVLLNHYKSLTEGPEGQAGCMAEYKSFVSFVKDHAIRKTCKTLQELALEYLSKESLSQLFPVMSKLIVHALVLPMSTTYCERCFSAMNRTKTDFRNRMHTKTLDSLLEIHIEGPPLPQFNFREAAERWANAKKRRLFGN